jgi:hypothetical protein
MSTDHHLNYEINVSIFNKEYSKIERLVFYRLPISKYASIVNLSFNIDTSFVRELTETITKNEYPNINIKIFSVDEANPEQYCRDRRISKIFDKDYICLKIETSEQMNLSSNTTLVNLVLSHSIFYNLSLKKACNMIKNDISSYDAIKEYEKWLVETYGENFFFREIISEKGKSKNKKLEQILYATKNDLEMPFYLKRTYKPVFGFLVYFFDDFYMADDSDKVITVHSINLSDVDLFKVEEEQYTIQMGFLEILKEEVFYDPWLRDRRGEDHGTTRSNTTTIPVGGDKRSGKPLNNVPQPGKTETTTIDGKQVKIPSSGQNQQKPDPSGKPELNDDIKNPLTEIDKKTGKDKDADDILRDNIKKMAQTSGSIRSLVSVKNSKTLPSYYQFGKLYQIDIENIDGHHMSPINLVNIFTRKSSNDDDMSHEIFGLFIKYKLESNNTLPKIN